MSDQNLPHINCMKPIRVEENSAGLLARMPRLVCVIAVYIHGTGPFSHAKSYIVIICITDIEKIIRSYCIIYNGRSWVTNHCHLPYFAGD